MMRHRGLIVAALTPRGKRGELNFGACFELIDHLCKANVPGIALLTAAGEYPAFTVEERTRLVYLAARRSRDPAPGRDCKTLDSAGAKLRQSRDRAIYQHIDLARYQVLHRGARTTIGYELVACASGALE